MTASTGVATTGVATTTAVTTTGSTTGSGPNPPVATPDFAQTLRDTPVEIDVLINDFDIDNNLDESSLMVGTLGSGSVVVTAGNTLIYIPSNGFVGIDMFTYIICDTTNLCDEGVVTVNVTCLLDACGVCDGDNSTCCHNYLGVDNYVWSWLLIPHLIDDIVMKLEDLSGLLQTECDILPMECTPRLRGSRHRP